MRKRLLSPFILLITLCAISVSVHAQGFGEEGDPGGDLPPVVVTPPPPPPPPPSIPPPDPCQLNPCSCNPQSCGAPPENPCVTNPCSCSPACSAPPPPPTVPPLPVPPPPSPNPKPKQENPNPCVGIQNMWTDVTTVEADNPEGFGYITADQQFIFTATVGGLGGAVGTLTTIVNGNTTTCYYEYPMSAGAPTGNYAGIKNDGTNYMIPVVATVHTHNECLNDNTNGIENGVSASDKALANAHPTLRNYVIGCGAVGSYAAGDNSYTQKNGDTAANCAFFH